jgi:dTDP-4-amino-4,6-dideoxygalactose transaminase
MDLVASAGAVGRGAFKWVHRSFGSNFRLSEVQAAVGRVQLRRLPEWVALRRANAAALDAALAGAPGVELALPPVEALHAYYRYYFYVRPEALAPGWDRDKVVAALLDRGVPCQVGSCSEIYREEAFTSAGFAPESRLPGAASSQDRSVALYVHPGLGDAEMRWFASQVAEVMSLAVAGEGM